MIPYAEPVYHGNEEKYVLDALRSRWISGGEYIEKFEKSLETWLQQPVITTSNGTSALELAYLAFGLKGSIIVPAFGFMAAANVAHNLGIEPIFADVLHDTWNLDPKDVEKRINKWTAAIVAIHSYGNMCDMSELREVANAYKLVLIEDSAESLFSSYWGMQAGTISDLGTYSFHATKTITTGEGGAVTTHLPGLEKFLRIIKNHGLEARGNYNHFLQGMNFRMTNLQAAIGLAQMEHSEDVCIIKKGHSMFYRENLFGKEGITLQEITNSCEPIFWSNAVKLDNPFPSRDEVVVKMREFGIEVRPGFLSPTYLQIYGDRNTPVADELSQKVISLPCGLNLTKKDIDYVCEKLLECRE